MITREILTVGAVASFLTNSYAPEEPVARITWGPDGIIVELNYPKRDPDCEKCDTDTHRCPGCGEPLRHGQSDCGAHD